MEIKGCPFCGGEAKKEGQSVFNGCVSRIRCKCGAMVEIRAGDMSVMPGGGYYGDAAALAAWNARAEGWVRVENGLPPHGERVLAEWGGFVGEAFVDICGNWKRYNSENIRDYFCVAVTKWRKMPKPPEV